MRKYDAQQDLVQGGRISRATVVTGEKNRERPSARNIGRPSTDHGVEGCASGGLEEKGRSRMTGLSQCLEMRGRL